MSGQPEGAESGEDSGLSARDGGEGRGGFGGGRGRKWREAKGGTTDAGARKSGGLRGARTRGGGRGRGGMEEGRERGAREGGRGEERRGGGQGERTGRTGRGGGPQQRHAVERGSLWKARGHGYTTIDLETPGSFLRDQSSFPG